MGQENYGEACVRLAKEHFGENLSEKEVSYLLWNATAFPFGDVDYIEEQLAEAAKYSNGHVGVAVDLATRMLEKAMERLERDG